MSVATAIDPASRLDRDADLPLFVRRRRRRRLRGRRYVDYDGYVAVYDASGPLVPEHDYNLGRGDVLASLRLAPDGVVADGSAGWDRWQGAASARARRAVAR